MATGDGDVQRVPAKQSSPLSRPFATQPSRVGIRLWISDRESDEGAWIGDGNREGRRSPEGRAVGGAGFLGRFSLRVESFDCLAKKRRRKLFSGQSIRIGPFFGEIVRAKKFVDPWKVDREIFVDAFGLRGVVPMMVSGHHEEFFEPL